MTQFLGIKSSMRKILRSSCPQTNCTYRATAVGERILVPSFADRGVSRRVAWAARHVPTAYNLSFIGRIRYFFIHVAPQLSSLGRVGPVSHSLILR
jgi:hypothetical protein